MIIELNALEMESIEGGASGNSLPPPASSRPAWPSWSQQIQALMFQEQIKTMKKSGMD